MSRIELFHDVLKITAVEALAILSEPEHGDAALIDVRSEAEYAQGKIPGFQNLPILTDSERHQVGLIYMQQGQEAAIHLGQRLVAPYRLLRLEAWRAAIEATAGHKAIVSCWRGGLRSRIAAEWMAEYTGSPIRTVEGGYKAIRAELLQSAQAAQPAFLVLAGLTGSRKTELLTAAGPARIDLEEFAAHRGSAFGGIAGVEQPSQATFENQLFLAIYRAKQARRPEVLVEDESSAIGRVLLPNEIKDRIVQAPLVLLEVGLDDRALHIARTYVLEPMRAGISAHDHLESMRNAVKRISKRLGGLLTSKIIRALEDAFMNNERLDEDRHLPWIRELLEHYYDRLYLSGLKSLNRPVLFRGNYEECQQWIQNRFA
ncbi:tRNA 2-selenouridine(34) synthase MnmH [Bdellovibrionota bacterium FG-1]